MVFDLNKGSFNGAKALAVSPAIAVSPNQFPSPPSDRIFGKPKLTSAKESPLPTVDQIIDRYVQALGGEQAFRKVTSRVRKKGRE